MCYFCAVDSGAMTDSVITDSCPPANTDQVPTQPSYDDMRPGGEFERDSHTTAAATTVENPTATAVKVNGYTGHTDAEDRAAVENGKATSRSVSTGNTNGPTTVDMDADCTELCSSDLRTEDCGVGNRRNSTSTTVPMLTNGHV